VSREQKLRDFIQQLTGSFSLLEFEKLAKSVNSAFPHLPEEAPS
jgi:hypothetical protein